MSPPWLVAWQRVFGSYVSMSHPECIAVVFSMPPRATRYPIPKQLCSNALGQGQLFNAFVCMWFTSSNIQNKQTGQHKQRLRNDLLMIPDLCFSCIQLLKGFAGLPTDGRHCNHCSVKHSLYQGRVYSNRFRDFVIFLERMLFNSRDEPESTACELLACLFGYGEAVDKVQLLICTCSNIQHKQTGQNKQRLRNH